MSLIPDRSTWKHVALGEVAAASKERVDPADGSIERYVAGEHMDTDDLKIHRWGCVSEIDLGPAFHRRFRPGQVLYGSRRTYLRKVAVADFDGVCANTTFVVETKNDSLLSQEFLPFVMTSEPFHAFAIQESKGSVNPYVNWSDIERYEFHLPPIEEQKRIADLLWSAEYHRRALATRAATALQLEREFVLAVLTLSGKRVKIEDLGLVLLGRQRSPENASGDHMRPYLRVANVGDNELKLDDINEMNFDPAEFDRYSIEVGDILVSEGQSRELVGQSAIVTEPLPGLCFQNTLIRYRATKVSPEMGFALVRALFYSGQFAAIASQTTSIAHLGVRRFAECEVPCPSAEASAEYLSRLEAVSSARALANAELATFTLLHTRLVGDIFG